MTHQNNGGPAFPQNDAALNRINNHEGMSLRDYFAAMALQGILAKHGPEDAETASRISYEYANAMLAQRERE